MPPLYDATGLVERTRAVLDWARRTQRAVAFVRHDGTQGEALAPGQAGWPVWPALGQAEEEPTFSKVVGDAFSNADLGQWVADQGAHEVVLLGAQTDQCVAATVKGALGAGLKVTVVSDAHSTWDYKGETAGEIIERLNGEFADEGAHLVTTQVLTAHG
jgi:nicotinamidase-related amidase